MSKTRPFSRAAMPYRTLVNNHVFFQHPDLVRILGIHENVIAIMMNSIARASQDESGETASGEGQGLEEDTSHEMVSRLSIEYTHNLVYKGLHANFDVVLDFVRRELQMMDQFSLISMSRHDG